MVDRVSYSAFASHRRKSVLGITFSPLSQDMLIRQILSERVPQGSGVRLVATANVDHISNLVRNARFRAAYARAWVVTADGAPVYAYARLRGSDLSGRVTGADLTSSLLNRMEADSCRPFFVTSSDEAGQRLRTSLVGRGFAADAIALVSSCVRLRA